MITHEDNLLLCQVEGSSPAGQMMRQHWIPICLSEEVSEADGTPVKAGHTPMRASGMHIINPPFTLAAQLREALPHHIVLSKLPLVRFCQPNDPQQVRFWYELLGSLNVTFAVCSANGRVLAAIDLYNHPSADFNAKVERAINGAFGQFTQGGLARPGAPAMLPAAAPVFAAGTAPAICAVRVHFVS